ncbi:hypothetical protein [Sinomicrobium weinanense]|uniref:Secreted protein n=1 Tax=Sinomicrobium weinanense TaxID=2842200 RepID=A0A926JPL4_9FLAO|nr:hypothetical protein [Sinomicrobium weinanense]MBC9795135.1 hypothetical protein [Sinomicrobium weinanense]MBU3123733.1 hypothetical protein [Sinomicrobium weinanense]
MKIILKITALSMLMIFFSACTQSDDFVEETQNTLMTSTVDTIPEVEEDKDEGTQVSPGTSATGDDASVWPDNERD